jgi:diguanylate cyclase (GGDEF)-like protein/putative nucleotidyltransferase with HDIG domain
VKKLPFSAKIYLLAVELSGIVCSIGFREWIFRDVRQAPLAVATLLVISALVAGKKLTLPAPFLKAAVSPTSLVFDVVLIAFLGFGPGAAILTSCAACLSSSFFPNRKPLHRGLFNLGLSAVSVCVGASVYRRFWNLEIGGNGASVLVLATSAALCCQLVGAIGMSVMLWLSEGECSLTLWREDFGLSAPAYLLLAVVAALGTLATSGSNAVLLLFLMPVFYQFFRAGADNQNRIKELARHEAAIQESRNSLADLYLAAIRSLALAIDAKDRYTHQHILRVQRYAVAVAEELGIKGAELQAVSTGALLHDIGKIGVPEYVLMKPGRLSQDEFDKIRRHPEIGAAILDPVEFPWPVLPVVRSHHEKWDGTGYPDGLKGEEIPLSARVMAVADVYDALTSSRSYRTAWTHERAVELIRRDAGSHFDPRVVDAFLKVIDHVVQDMAKSGHGPLAPRVTQSFESLDKAAQAAIQISNNSIELYAFHEVIRSLDERLSVNELVECLCQKLENIYADALLVVLLGNGADGTLQVRAAVGPNAEFFRSAKPVGTLGVTVAALLSGKTFNGSYDNDDLFLRGTGEQDWAPLQTQIVVPLNFNGNSIGTLNCYHRDQNVFTAQDQTLLETVARHAAAAIHKCLLNSRLENEGEIDQLTGALTLRRLAADMDSGTEKSEPFTLICLDVDGFGAINDTFGHSKGDAVLCGVAEILRQTMGPNLNLCRYGPDQFVVVIPKIPPEGVAEISHKLDRAAKLRDWNLYHVNVGKIRVSFSFGAASSAEEGGNFDSVFLSAEQDLNIHKALKKLKPAHEATIKKAA